MRRSRRARDPAYRSVGTWRGALMVILVWAVAAGCSSGTHQSPPQSTESLLSRPGGSGAAAGTGGTDAALGLLVVVPESTGALAGPESLSAARQVGADYLRVSIDWAQLAPSPDELDFSRVDTFVSSSTAAGLRLFPTLNVGTGWMNQGSAMGGNSDSRSFPPSDLTEEWDPEYGYSRTYSEFLTKFFIRYQGEFDYVAIENEMNAERFWGGTPEAYIRLLQTAHHTISRLHSAPVVVSGGAPSVLLGLCAIQDVRQNDWWSEEQQLAFGRLYYSAATVPFQVNSIDDLNRLLRRDRIQAECREILYVLDRQERAVDAINIHFYEDYRTLPGLVSWLRLRQDNPGQDLRFLSNEIGDRGGDGSYAAGGGHANSVTKKIVTAMSLGMNPLIWFSVDSYRRGRDKVGLFEPGGETRPAGLAFRQLAALAELGYRPAGVVAAGPELFHHSLRHPKTGAAAEIMWSEGSGGEVVELRPPVGAERACVWTAMGGGQSLEVIDGALSLLISEKPAIVRWESCDE